MTLPDQTAFVDQQSPVLFELLDNGVAVVTLNRPERMNARGGGLAAAFYRCMDRAEADPNVRVIVLTGNGRAFCAGADMGDGGSIGGAAVDGDTDVTARVVGWSASLDLLLSGRTIFAEVAAELGLVKEVVSPDELMPRALAYAADIALHCAPSALAVIKRQIYGDALRNVHDTSDRAETLMHESMRRPDFIEGITAFFEKRPPTFPPLEEDQ